MDGAINFTDLLGIREAGRFRPTSAGGEIKVLWGINKFDIDIDVFELQAAAEYRSKQLDSWKKFLDQGYDGSIKSNNIPVGSNLSYSSIASARRNTLLDIFGEVLHHEGGGHGLRPGLDHGPLQDASDYLNDPSYVSGFNSQYMTGAVTVRGMFGSLMDGQLIGNLGGLYFDGVVPASTFNNVNASERATLNAGGKNIVTGPFDSPHANAEPLSATTARIIAEPDLFFREFGEVLGSAVGRYLFSDQPFAALPASALLGTLGRNVADFISAGGVSADLGRAGAVFDRTFTDFGQELGQAFRSAAIGSVSSFLTLELGNIIGIEGFGSELLQTGASSLLGQVLNNSIDIANGGKTVGELFTGLSGEGLFQRRRSA